MGASILQLPPSPVGSESCERKDILLMSSPEATCSAPLISASPDSSRSTTMLDLPEISSLELSDFPDRQRSISFDDSIQVCEFVAVDLDPSIVSWSLPERPV